MRRRSQALAGALAVLLTGCAALRPGSAPDPFKVPRGELVAQLKVVAVVWMAVPRDLPDAQLARARTLASIDARLRSSGLVVISAGDAEPLLRDVLAEMPKERDPATGQIDVAMVQVQVQKMFDRLAQKFGRVDALVGGSMLVVQAPVVGGSAAWDGITEPAAASDGGVLGSWWRPAKELKALSIFVSLLGNGPYDLYRGDVGVQLLEKLSADGERVPVAREAILSDGERESNAVDVALAPLLDAIRESRDAAPAAAP